MMMSPSKAKWTPMTPEENWNHMSEMSEFEKGGPCPYCGSPFVLTCVKTPHRNGCQACRKIWHERPDGRELMEDLLSK